MAEARQHRLVRDTVEFSLKGPVSVNINDEPINNSGCAVLDLHFTTPSQIGEVSFKNYYTMWLTVLIKTRITAGDTTGTNIGSLPAAHREDSTSDWLLSVARKVIMPYPHNETGSHDLVSICCSESCNEWRDLIAMRLVLRQPSPVWRTFHIEEINVYRDMPRFAPKDNETESLIMLIKRQTINALKWAPTTEGQGQTGAYEFTSLPLP